MKVFFELQRFESISNYAVNTIVSGTSDNDTIFNAGSVVTIQSGAGDDSIRNNVNLVKIYGGAGNDILTGGNGADIFVHSAGNDIIKDYTEGADVIKIQDTTIESWKIKKNDVIFTTDNGQITVKNGKGKAITITETKTYSNNIAELFTENNFETADNISDIVENNLTATDYKFETQNFDSLTENNFVTFTK